MKTLERHAASIKTSSFLSKLPLIGREQEEDVMRFVPAELIPLLQSANIDFVLAGAHGIGGWMKEPRATQDVDFIIQIKDRQRAAEAILKSHPELVIEKHPDVWRFKYEEAYLADLILARAPLFKRVLREYKVVPLNRRKIKIPKVESALALKFAAMTGHYRNYQKKHLDAHDFIGIAVFNSAVNVELLRELGELVYSGGGADIVKYLEDARAGRKLEI